MTELLDPANSHEHERHIYAPFLPPSQNPIRIFHLIFNAYRLILYLLHADTNWLQKNERSYVGDV